MTYAQSQGQEQTTLRSLKESELDLWLQFLADAFGKKYPNMLELFRMLVNNDKYFHVEDVLLLERNSNWLSTVHVTRKEVWLNGTRAKMAGIANAATNPAHQRQGHALKVMSYTPKHAIQVQGAWLAGLHCSKSELWPFYEKCGYTHIPLQEDHVTIKVSRLQCGQQQYTIQQCSFTETELQQMTTLHEGYFSSFTGPLCRSRDYCNWNTTYYNMNGVSFGCLYDVSQQEALQGECLKMTAYIGVRKMISKDNDGEVKIEIVEYAGPHDPSSHDNEFFMPLLCHMLHNTCHCQSGDHVSIKYQSLMCNKAWFSDMTTTEFETKLRYGFMFRYTDDQHANKDISKLLNRFVFSLIDGF